MWGDATLEVGTLAKSQIPCKGMSGDIGLGSAQKL